VSSETPGVGGAGKATTQASTVILGIQMNLEASSLFKIFAFNSDGLVALNRMVHNYRYDLLIIRIIHSSCSFICFARFTILTLLYHEDVSKQLFFS
jgi:hypothetical protein